MTSCASQTKIISMETFASVWLPRAALAAAVIFAYSSVKVLFLNPRGSANRIAALFNVVFMLWAIAAIFWYSAKDAGSAQFWYDRFYWCWCVFPPLGFHFNLKASRNPEALSLPRHLPQVIALYLPAFIFILLIPRYVFLDPPEFHGGYWMVNPRMSFLYFLYDAHFLIYTLAAVWIAFRGSVRATNTIERNRLAILAVTTLIPLVLSLVTDAIFIMLKIDFPNMAIFWILILSSGMLFTMNRYGFLSSLPVTEAPRVLDALADIVVYFDETGHVAWANKSAILAMGFKNLQDIRGKSPETFIAESDVAKLRSVIYGDAFSYEAMSSFGPLKLPVALRFHHVKEHKIGRGAVVTGVDLSSQHRLADKGLLLEEFIDNSRDGILLTDSDGVITRWNRPVAEISGISAQEAIGKKLWQVLQSILPGGDAPDPMDFSLERSVNALFKIQASPFRHRVLDQEIKRPDGTERKIQSNIFVIPSQQGAVLAAIIRDVTDEKRAAEDTIERIKKLDHAQKMDAVGSLTSGIAHDFNNTLAGIIGTLSLIRLGLDDGSYSKPADIEPELTIMERSAERAASSVKRLLSITKKRPHDNAPFRLETTLRHVIEFAARSVHPSVSIEMEPFLGEALISGDSGQVEQLLLNLIINAEQAMTVMMPDGAKPGGTIRLALKKYLPEPEFLSTNPQAEAVPYWVISVKDQGVGIPSNILARIFDPFYTTKSLDKSSGLGLSMVHSIAKGHGGFVNVHSEPGHGSEFSVYLPAGDSIPEGKSKTSPKHGSGQVLVVDDDDMLREVATTMLGALGYQSHSAVSGEDAIEIFSANPDSWSAIVMDLRMTGMPGDAAAREIRKIRPRMPVIIASGYVPEETEGIDHEFIFVAKPYSVTELGDALARVVK